MAKRRSKSAAGPPNRPAPARRAKKKPAPGEKKLSGSATGTESLREEAERGWAKLDRQIARRQKRDLARTHQRAKSKSLDRRNRAKGKPAHLADRA